MTQHTDIIEKLRKFATERNWEKYLHPKDITIAASVEMAELLEHFEWKTPEEFQEYLKTHKEDVGDELADVLIYLFQLADKLDVDIYEVIESKMKKNAIKYPVAEHKK